MYLLIENFNSGLDSRRMALTSKPGTLQDLTNAHITRGGEIEKRKSFELACVADSQSFGLHAANGSLWTFGSEAELPGDILGFAPGPDPNNVVPRVNYMQLNSGGYNSKISLNPFAFRMIRDFPERGALVVDIPNGGIVPTLPYQQLYIKFNNTGPTNGLYYTNVIRTGVYGYKKLIIYPGYTSTYPFLPVALGNDAFVKYTGSITWSVTNGSTPETTSPVSKYSTIVCYSGAIASGSNNYNNIDGFYVTSKEDSSPVSACSLLCHSSLISESPSPYDIYEALFVSGEANCPTDHELFAVFSTSKLNSLAYNASGTAVDVIPASTPVSFYPTSTSRYSTVDWKLYSTHKNWSDFLANKLCDAINSRTSFHQFNAAFGSGYIWITTASSNYTGTTGPGWVPVFPFISNPSDASEKNDSSFSSYPKLSAKLPMVKLLSVDNFKGKIYAIAEFEGGSVKHFYNGKQVTSWDSIANSGDAKSVAAELALQINEDGLYSSTSSNNEVYIQFVNKNENYSVSVRVVDGGVDTTQSIVAITTPADANSPQFTKLIVSGGYEQLDVFTVIIQGKEYTVQAASSIIGKFCKTHSDKVYSTSGSLLYFSETSTNGGPSAFTNNTQNGAGVINLSGQDSSAQNLTSIAIYQGKLAIFSENSVQVWTMNADPKLNTFSQILTNIGTSSPRSVVSLGNIDTYFLSPLGIRSLRARDASNVAIVSDIGNAIDDIVISDMRGLTQDQRDSAVGLIDPIDGRYWLCVGNKIYVYSYFPASNINAWSIYEPSFEGNPFEVEHICCLNQRIYVRSGSQIYAYGGINGSTYDDCEVVVTMPYLDGGKPGHFKTLLAVDSACVGEWEVYSGTDIMAPDVRDYIGKINNSTYSMGRVSGTGFGSHIGIQMKNNTDGYAKIGNFAVHFEVNDAG